MLNQKLKEKIVESLSAVLPITMIVLVISVLIVPIELGTITMFIVGAIMLIVGMGLFQLGAEISMTPLGEGIGAAIFNKDLKRNSKEDLEISANTSGFSSHHSALSSSLSGDVSDRIKKAFGSGSTAMGGGDGNKYLIDFSTEFSTGVP